MGEVRWWRPGRTPMGLPEVAKGLLSAGLSYSADLDDLSVARKSSLETNGDGSGVLEVDRIHALHVDVGCGAVARVAALTHLVTNSHGLPD
jgi:hypothetical protein